MLTQKDFDALQPGVNALNEARAQSNLDRLKAYLSQQQTDKNIESAKGLETDYMKNRPGFHGTFRVGPNGVEIAENQNFNPMLGKGIQGDAAARMAAEKTYNSGLPKIQQSLLAASEGLDAVNDPNNKMSRGQFLGTATRALGLSRFPNAEEAKQLLPPSLQGYASEFGNWAGDTKNTMNDADVAAANSFLKSIVQTKQQEHEMLKRNALGMYQSSPFANPEGIQALSSLGSPMDEQFGTLSKKYASTPQTRATGPQQPGQPPQNVQTQPTGLAGFFSRLTGGGGQHAPVAPKAPPLQQAPGQDDPADFQNFYNNVWKKMKNAGPASSQ